MNKCKVIAILNQKGGVAKTTTTINLGAALSQQGKKVLLVDLDPQSSLTMCMGIAHPNDDLSISVSDLIYKIIKNESQYAPKDYILTNSGMDFIPSDNGLTDIELAMVMANRREYVLRKILAPLKDEYDYILIDCQPNLSLIPLNALVATDSILIPVQAHYCSAKGLESLFETISETKQELNPGLHIEGVLVTIYEQRHVLDRAIFDLVQQLCSTQNVRVFNTAIPKSVRIAESQAKRKTIFEYMPRSKAALCYKSVAKELTERGE